MSGKTTKQGVFATWVVALNKYGHDPKTAIPKIHSFMRQQFPKRKTNWASWANLVRQRYNRGAFVKGAKPRKAIPVFPERRKAA